jgi:hypothetical protein
MQAIHKTRNVLVRFLSPGAAVAIVFWPIDRRAEYAAGADGVKKHTRSDLHAQHLRE